MSSLHLATASSPAVTIGGNAIEGRAHRRFGKGNLGRIAKLLEAADKDHDGNLDPSEFAALVEDLAALKFERQRYM